MRVHVALSILLLASCDADSLQQDDSAPFALQDVLGGADAAGFLRADAPRAFSFPEDHGPHPGFRNEWWYFTGNVETAEGRRFGYQVTFFNAALRSSAFADASAGQVAEASSWQTQHVWMAHLAVSDIENAEHHAFERFSRESPGLAGATSTPLHVWLDDWQLTTQSESEWRLQAAEAGIALDLNLASVKAPVLQGVDGLSQKGREAGNASYYYSVTRIATDGMLRIGDEAFTVSGSSWLDREWSTSALDDDQSGWDWFSLQFDDGQELMYYQLRTETGVAHPNSQGNWTDTAARQTLLTPDTVTLTELDTWTSPSGIAYTTAWSLAYAGRTWRVEALFDEQWMNLTIPYWEGAVDVRDENGERIGRGYLEMVRN